MLRRIPRLLRRAVIVAVVLAVSVSVYQSWTAGSPGVNGWTQTQFGPLGPADRDLLVKVRLAGLWETPTGQQAQQQAASPQVREIAGKISAEHVELDRQVREVADQLGVSLPTSASPQQVAWMTDISSRTGADYDRVFVQRLRAAHGTILPVVNEVRTGTRNELVRKFAVTADQFVSRHCEYLESSGLVDYADLPTPRSPGLLSGSTEPKDLVGPILVFVAAVLAAIGLVSALRGHAGSRPARITVPQPAPATALAARTPVSALPGSRAAPTELTASDSGTYRRAPTPSGDRSGAGPYRPPTSRSPTGPGAYRAATGTGSYRARPPADRSAPDTEALRTVSGSDAYRSVTDSGGYRAVTDSGGYRAVADPDAPRSSTRIRSRHSTRR